MIDKAATRACRLRYAIRVQGEYGTYSKRLTYCCRERYGFMLKHWKCVGLDQPGCPLLKEADSGPQPTPAPSGT